MNWNVVIIFFILLAQSCVLDSDLPFPQGERQVVLNSILRPDSVINVKLTFSRGIEDTTRYAFISNAVVKVFENDNELPVLRYVENGNYRLDYFPVPEKTYRVEASVPGYKIVSGEDVIPAPSIIAACYRKRSQGVVIPVDIISEVDKDNFYYIELLTRDTTVYTSEFYIHSNTPFLDHFNAILDVASGTYEYTTLLRFDDIAYNPGTFTVIIEDAAGVPFIRNITKLKPGQSVLVNVYTVSPQYDKYLKSTILDFINNDFDGSLSPFSGVIKIHSNIQNGKGIFAGMNMASVEVNKNPCQ